MDLISLTADKSQDVAFCFDAVHAKRTVLNIDNIAKSFVTASWALRKQIEFLPIVSSGVGGTAVRLS